MQHFSSPSYIIHHNSYKSDNYFYSTNAKTILRVSIKNCEFLEELVCCGCSIQFIVGGGDFAIARAKCLIYIREKQQWRTSSCLVITR